MSSEKQLPAAGQLSFLTGNENFSKEPTHRFGHLESAIGTVFFDS
jgi:hypothetical protein